MEIQRLAAFTLDGQGGNPAGVVIGDALPSGPEMQQIAADVGYSETAFAAREKDGFRVRYFAPEGEVAFCGHATIALGAALGRSFGEGHYQLYLNHADISVSAKEVGGNWGATLVSPESSYSPMAPAVLDEVLQLFGLTHNDLDDRILPAMANAGAAHLLLPVGRHETVRDMEYSFDGGAAFMQAQELVTINLFHREPTGRIHSRNAFAGHGVYEDPATGAAAAALAGYLRDTGVETGEFEVIQGVDMGFPSRLRVRALVGNGASIEISGLTRTIE